MDGDAVGAEPVIVELSYTCPQCGHITRPPEGRRSGYCEHCHEHTGVPTEIPKAS